MSQMKPTQQPITVFCHTSVKSTLSYGVVHTLDFCSAWHFKCEFYSGEAATFCKFICTILQAKKKSHISLNCEIEVGCILNCKLNQGGLAIFSMQFIQCKPPS